MIAKTGDQGLTGLGIGPSINDSGTVAFVGNHANGNDGIFAGNGTPGSLFEVSAGTSLPNPTFRSNLQINNAGQIAAVDGLLHANLRLWNAADRSSTILYRADSTPGGFDSFFDSESVSNDGGVAYIGKLTGATTVILNRDTDPISSLPSPQPFLRPMIADGGLVVARTDHDATNPSQNPIKLFAPGGPAAIIASMPQFSSMGSSPGISDDGTVITFYGERDENGDGVSEPGIFASIKTDQGRVVKRIAGVAGNGYLDPGETFDDTNDNRKLDPGEDKGLIDHFDTAARVGVGTFSPQKSTIVFVAYDAAGHKGIYTSDLTSSDDANPKTVEVSPSSLVVDSSKPIVAFIGNVQTQLTIQNLSVYDPINKSGQIAFWVKTADGTDAILRATPARVPVLIIPGIIGTYAKDIPNDVNWLLNRGVPPDQLQIDPIANVYNDLITTLKTAGYQENKDLFIVTYDWRVPVAPTDKNFDGHIAGLTGQNITSSSSSFQYGVDYLGYYLKQASQIWATNHPGSPPLESVDVIAHSTGGLVARAYMQSSAYGDTFGSSTQKLPKIDEFIMLGVPNQGASKAWNILQDDWNIDPTFGIVIKNIIARAFNHVVTKNAVIHNPDGTVINLASILDANLKPDPLKFIKQYVPTIQDLLATYDFGIPDNNSDPNNQNSLVLDLNGGRDQNAFATLSDVTAIYGFGQSTPTTVTPKKGGGGLVQSFTDSYPGTQTAFLKVWYQDNFTIGNGSVLTTKGGGDGTVPLISSVGLFATDTRVSKVAIADADHTGLVSNLKTQEEILRVLGYPITSNLISQSISVTDKIKGAFKAARLVWVNDPVDGILVDMNGKRLGYTQATGALAEIPGSMWLGGADGMGIVFGPVSGPLQLNVNGLGENYAVQVDAAQSGLFAGVASSGFLAVGQSLTFPVVFASVQGYAAPVAMDDQAVTGVNRAVVLALLANDVAGVSALDTTTLSISSTPQHGTLSTNPITGAVTFTPTTDFVGNDTFTYSVGDLNGVISNVATVHVAVQPRMTITDVGLAEGNVGTRAFDFTISVSHPVGQPVSLDFATADDTASVGDNDYTAINGTLTFAPGGPLTQTIRVLVVGDKKDEQSETFFVKLSNVVNATVDKAQGVGTIQNDDTTVSIVDVTQNEGNAGFSSFVFAVSLSQPSVFPVTVEYATANGTATLADNDYQAKTGSVSFAPGETKATISISVNGDAKPERDETFLVKLVNPMNGSLATGGAQGYGFIRDDDFIGINYYVNDASTTGDVFTTAVGGNANDGKTPDKPLASLTALLTLYQNQLQPGDTIYMDSGNYNLSRNIVLGAQQSGIRIIGAGNSDVTPTLKSDVVLADNPVAYWRLGD
ncbi:MAG: Ig-like domain-containing protein, partial [Planctomycetia bacterium]|nr:Ig-like domain-containing protein [Planctomycetia bacterium]